MPAPLIAHIVHRLDYGGLENGLVNLINGLPEGHARHCIICLTTASDFRRRIKRGDVDVHELAKKPGQDLAAYLRLWKLLRSLRPRVVHTRNTGVIDCQIAAFLAGVPVRIHGYHGWDVDDLTGDNPRRTLLRRLCDPFVSRYIVVSRQIRDWLVTTHGVSADRISQIYNGVDTDKFSPAPTPPARDEKTLVIGTVGRLQAVKNQILLVEAFGHLLGQRPDLASRLRLVIVGDGPERDRLELAIRQAGAAQVTTLAGWNDDVPAMLRQLSVFVLPSLNEGISNTILEAMACGIPVIATDVGGNPELVLPGETGFLVPVADPPALAEAVSRYADSPDLRLRHGAAARGRAEADFSLRRMLAAYDDLYCELANLNRAA